MDKAQPTLISSAWKHPFLVAIVVAVFIAGGFAFAALQGSNQEFVGEAVVVLRDPNITEGETSARFVTEQVQILRSPIVAAAAADIVNDDLEGDQVTADDLLAATDISSSADSTLVFLSAFDDDPDRAVLMVNAMANGYDDVTLQQATQNGVAALERIDAQIEALESRFNEVSGAIEAERDSNTDLTQLEAQFEQSLAMIVQLQAELPTASDTRAEEIRTEISDLQLRISNYQQAVSASRDSPELQAALQEQSQLINRRTELIQRRDQIEIDIDLDAGAVSLLQPAEQATEIIDSSPLRTLFVAAAMGLFAAAGAAYFLEQRRRLFDDRLQPQSVLAAPLLADIPPFSDEHLSSPIPVREAPASAAAEGFRFAAAAIADRMMSRDAKSLMFVSSTVGHGKSTSIVNTAMADARRGHSVLLIDCDFGTQDAARLALGTEPVTRAGLVDIVEDGVAFDRAVTNLSLGGEAALSLMGQGTRPAVAANLLLDPASAAAFDAARSEYDIVFVDGPPILQVAYGSTLANRVDALVVVVSHGTPVKELEDLVGRLQLIDTPVLGYVYNRSPLRREMTRREGSMRDILDNEVGATVGRRPWWRRVG